MAQHHSLRGRFWVSVVLCGLAFGGCSGSSSGPVPPPPPPPPPPPAPAAAKLAFIGQPSNAVAGAANTPAVQVAVQDAQGNTVTTATTSITVAIGTNPAGGTLSGTMTVAAVNGIATFSTLNVNRAAAGYTLTASAASLASATSSAFNISAAAAAKLVFTVQPSNAAAGAANAPAVQVAVQDAQGNAVTTATTNITMAIGTNPASGTLSGTMTVAAISGVATFSTLSLDKSGTGYTLTAAASGLTGATSSAFNVVAPATAAPMVETRGVTVPSTNASLYGSVTPGGLATTAWFEWGPSSSLATFSSTPMQSLVSGPTGVPVSAGLTGLNSATTYYYRAAASSSGGMAKGAILTFTTPPPCAGPVTSSANLFAESIHLDPQTGASTSDLFVVQPSVCGSDQLVGGIKTASGFRPVITDLALAPSGTLWAISFDALYKIDPSTAIATSIGSLGVSTANALVAAPSGLLYGATQYGDFFAVNSSTGAATIIGTFGSGLLSQGDLAFRPDGTLFGIAYTSTGVSVLVTVDPTSGRATPVQTGISIGFSNVFGVAFVGADLFGLTGDYPFGDAGHLIVISGSTQGVAGVGTLVRNLSFSAGGAGASSKVAQ